MTQVSILCVGHVNWDVIRHVEIPDPDGSRPIKKRTQGIGGSAANTAIVLSQLGCDVSTWGEIGHDEFGTRAEEELQQQGVEPLLEKSDTGTLFVEAIISEGVDPRYFADNIETEGISPERLSEDEFEKFDHIHITAYPEQSGKIAQKAKSHNCTVSFNPSQDYKNKQFDDVVEFADVIIMNDNEVEEFKNRHNFQNQREDTILIVTHGAGGATVYSTTGDEYTHPGFNVSMNGSDTLGAGDSFVAGFLSQWTTGESLEQSLEIGNAVGACAVKTVGVPKSVDEDNIGQILSEGPPTPSN